MNRFYDFMLPYFALCTGFMLSCHNPTTSNAAQVESTSPFDQTQSEMISNSTDSLSLLHFPSGIRSILQDSKGNFWFGSYADGVCRFDGETYTYFTTANGLDHNQVRTIQEHVDGSIWFGTGGGVTSYQNGQFELRASLGLTPSYAEAKWSLLPDDLWFHSVSKTGPFRYNGNNFEYLPLPVSAEKIDNDLYTITGIAQGKENLWFATYNGVFGFDGTNFTIITDESLNITDPDEQLHVRSILEDSNGNLWIGNNGIGVLVDEGEGVYNFSGKHGLRVGNTADNGSTSPKGTLEHVFSIEEDQYGTRWFGDRDTGVWSWSEGQLKNYGPQDGLPDAMIWDIYTDQQNRLLFGAADGGVYAFNGDSFERAY